MHVVEPGMPTGILRGSPSSQHKALGTFADTAGLNPLLPPFPTAGSGDSAGDHKRAPVSANAAGTSIGDAGCPEKGSAHQLTGAGIPDTPEIDKVAKSNSRQTISLPGIEGTVIEAFSNLAATRRLESLAAIVPPGLELDRGPAVVMMLNSCLGDANRGRSSGVMSTQTLALPSFTQRPQKRFRPTVGPRKADIQRAAAAPGVGPGTTSQQQVKGRHARTVQSAARVRRRATSGVEGRRSSRLPQIPKMVQLVGMQPVFDHRSQASVLAARRREAIKRKQEKEAHDRQLEKIRGGLKHTKALLATSLRSANWRENARVRWKFAGDEIKRGLAEKKSFADVVIEKSTEIKDLERIFLKQARESISLIHGWSLQKAMAGEDYTQRALEAEQAMKERNALRQKDTMAAQAAAVADVADIEGSDGELADHLGDPRPLRPQRKSFKAKVAAERKKSHIEDAARRKLGALSGARHKSVANMLIEMPAMPGDEESDSDSEDVADVVDYLNMTAVSLQGNNNLYEHIWFKVLKHGEDDAVTENEMMTALHTVSGNRTTDEEITFCKMALDIVDETSKFTTRRDYELFTIMASLSERVRHQNRDSMNRLDYTNAKLLKAKMVQSRSLFYLCDGAQTDGTMSLQEFEHTCMAGHVDKRVTNAILAKLEEEGKYHITFLDFLAFLPLFVNAHGTVLLNPLDFPSEEMPESRKSMLIV